MLKLSDLAELMSQRGISWTDKSVGLFIAFAFGGIAALASAKFVSDAAPWLYITVGIVFFVVGYGIWVLSCRVPRNKAGHVGIYLAIKAETDAERKRIRSDFISEIASSLTRADAAHPFYVVEIPGYLSPAVNDIRGAAEFIKKTKGHLLIWGGIKTRNKGKKQQVYSLRLESVVTHSTIALETSNALSREMRYAIPKKTEIDITNELQGFEAAANSFVIATKYIVALASALSGDLKFSKTLLMELTQQIQRVATGNKRKLRAKKEDFVFVKRLETALPRWLSDVSYAEYLRFARKWSESRDNIDLLLAAERSLEAYWDFERKTSRKGGGPNYWISKALLEVTLRNGFSEAERLLSKCKFIATGDPAWRLSLAFVQMVQGNYADALKLYDEALKLDVSHQLTFEIESFIQWWLSKNNGPAQLFLLSALLNAYAKSDFEMAKSDLEHFECAATKLNLSDSNLISRATGIREMLLKA